MPLSVKRCPCSPAGLSQEGFSSPRTHPSYFLLLQVVLYFEPEEGDFPLCLLKKWSVSQIVWVQHTQIVWWSGSTDVISRCCPGILGAVLLAFLFCWALFIVPLSGAHTCVYARAPAAPGSALALVVFLGLDLTIRSCCGHGFFVCRVLARTEFSVPKF